MAIIYMVRKANVIKSKLGPNILLQHKKIRFIKEECINEAGITLTAHIVKDNNIYTL